jgi:hypothetical protein
MRESVKKRKAWLQPGREKERVPGFSLGGSMRLAGWFSPSWD